MLIDSNIRDQAYQFFIQEALEFLQVLEEGLLNLQQSHGTPEIHALMRAAHSIKGGAASVGLEAIKKIAHQMEDVLRALYKDGVEIDAELEELLLQAYDCLRTPLIQQIQTGESEAEHWLEQSEIIFAQLVEKLGDAMFGESELPTAAELGIDIVQVIFSGDVEAGLKHLETVLADPNHPEIGGEMRAQAQVFIGMGELVNLQGFVLIAKTAEAAIDAHPERARDIVEIAVKDFRIAQQGVLAGDRTTGGEPSPELLIWISSGSAASILADEDTDDIAATDFTAAHFTNPVETDPNQSRLAIDTTPVAMDMSMWSMDDDDDLGDNLGGDLEYALDNLGGFNLAIESEVPTIEPLVIALTDLAVVADDEIEVGNAKVFDLGASEVNHSDLFVDWDSISNEDGDSLESAENPDNGDAEAWNSDHAKILRDTLSDTPIEDQPDLMDSLSIDLAHPSVSDELASDTPEDSDTAPWPIEQSVARLFSASFGDQDEDDFDEDEPKLHDWTAQDQLSIDDFVSPDEDSSVHAIAFELESKPIDLEPQADVNAADRLTQPAAAIVSAIFNDQSNASQMSDLSDMMSDLSGDLSEITWPSSLGLKSEALIQSEKVISDESNLIEPIVTPIATPIVTTTQSSISLSGQSNLGQPSPNDDDDIPTQIFAAVTLPSSNLQSGQQSKSPQSPAPKSASTASDAPMLSNSIRVDLGRLDRLNNLVGEMVSQENSAILQNRQLKDILNTVLQRVSRFDRLTRELRNLMDGSQTTRSQLTSHKSAISSESSLLSSQFDPLQMDDYSDLSMLMQETIDEVAQVGEAMRDMTLLSHQSQQTQRQKQQTLRQVRNDLLWARMLPIGDILQRFPRMIRDMSIKYSKTVAVKLTGTNTLVDKAMLEKLYDPLVHLVRNGFDHGIEPPEQREALGKPKEATLEIRAFHRGSQVYIEVIDDGRGIDTEKVLAKAIAKQVITAEEAQTLSREQVYDLLFAPGFSTADIISDLSGRGVGLDTVRSQVKSLKGGINISSEPGKGTTFTVRLPLTLTITKLLVFSIQSRLMAVPVDSLIAIVAAPFDQIQTLKNGKFYHWQEQFIPIYPQSIFSKHYAINNQTLEQPHSLTLPTKGKVPLLMLAGDAQTIALPVDAILYEQELAIKPFSKTITPPAYLYGCTLLGDGALVPVLDAQMLIANKQAEIVSQTKVKVKEVPVEPVASSSSNKNATILVIDDSLTTRQTLASVLQKAGYRTLQARDGREALEQLSQAPEIQAAFCDIEMPKMNGFEFLNACRQEYSKDILPVIMLSSRSNEKHRQVAKYMGANEYLTKPFFEHELLKTLGDLLTERSKYITDTQTNMLDKPLPDKSLASIL